MAIAVAFTFSLIATYAAGIALGRAAVLDVPNARSSHAAPVVRGGGIGVVFGLVAGALVADGIGDLDGELGILVAGAGLAAIGLLEDIWPDQPVVRRFVAQIAVAGLASALLLAGAGLGAAAVTVSMVASILWIVGFANVFNFMDGINGISGLQAAAIGGAFAAVGLVEDVDGLVVLGSITAAAALGFLPHNLPSARVFLGDVGSYLLGAVLATTAIVALRAGAHPVVVAAPFTLYLADTGTVLVRRVVRHDRFWEPHREHVYQRVVDAGWSHAATALLASAVTASVSAAVLVAEARGGAWWTLALLAGVAVVAYLLLPRFVSHSEEGAEQPAIRPVRSE